MQDTTENGLEESEMFTTPKSVKTLRQYYKNRNVPPSPDYLKAELQGESDRAIVILLSTLLADVLTWNIAKHLTFEPTEQQYDHIFRFEGPLCTFSARIEIAYLFAFIDELTEGQLDDIREMRNACAHTKHQIDFSVTELANVARRLFRPRGLTPLDETSQDMRKEIRGAFVMEFTFLYYILIERSREKGIALVLETMKQNAAESPPSPDIPPLR